MSFSIKNKAYLIKNTEKLDNVCKLKVLKLKPLKCDGDCKEVHLDLILKKLDKLKKPGLFMVEYSFDKKRFKKQKPSPRLSILKNRSTKEFAYDIKVPKSLSNKKTLRLDICITYDQSAWKIKHLDAHQM